MLTTTWALAFTNKAAPQPHPRRRGSHARPPPPPAWGSPGEAAGAGPARRARPALALVKAPGIEREVEEVARRILQQAAAGRPFRETGVIVRAPEIYVPPLRSTLERFGIPARFYFDIALDRHPVVRFLSGAIEAMLGGWDHARTLAVLRLTPRFADFAPADGFDFAVREQIPNAGLSQL